MSGFARIGALGDLVVAFSPANFAQLSFERTHAKAQIDTRAANHAQQILGSHAGAYTIRNVSVAWTNRPSVAEKTAIRSCIKP
jgi:hypothetical protein